MEEGEKTFVVLGLAWWIAVQSVVVVLVHGLWVLVPDKMEVLSNDSQAAMKIINVDVDGAALLMILMMKVRS